MTKPVSNQPISTLPVTENPGNDSLDSHAAGCSTDVCSTGTCSSGACPIHRAMWGLTAAIVIVGTLVLGYLYWITQQNSQAMRWQFPATVDATAAVTSEKFSMATGSVGDEAEGLFVLDHNSGLLQCKVIYPRIARFSAAFAINVADTLGATGKGGSYMMVTGQCDFPASSSRPAAATVVYVLNTATGNYAAYGIPFDRTAVSAGRPQQNALVLLDTGQANPVVDRDALR